MIFEHCVRLAAVAALLLLPCCGDGGGESASSGGGGPGGPSPVRSASLGELLGPEQAKAFVTAQTGLAKVAVLARAQRLEGITLDQTTGLRLADAVLRAFPWRDHYVDSRHQADLSALQRLAKGENARALSWIFVRLLDHPHPHVRLIGVQHLAELGFPEHSERLLALLKDPDAKVRGAVMKALVRLGGEKYAPAIEKLLSDKDPTVRRAAVRTLGAMPGPQRVEAIVKCLSDDSTQVRSTAATVLEEVGAKEALPEMKRVLATEPPGGTARVLAGAVRNLEALTGERRQVKVIRAMDGPDSRVEKHTVRLVRTAGDWETLWKGHAPGTPPPEVDFTKNCVVCLFHGRGWNSSGITATVDEDDGRVRVRYRNRWYQTDEEGDRVTPYALLVIPWTGKPVVVEEDVQGFIGGDPIWVERGRFE